VPKYSIAAHQVANVTLPMNTETVILTSGPVKSQSDSPRFLVIAQGQLQAARDATTVTPRVRRGTDVAGTLVGEANAEAVKGSNRVIEPFLIAVIDDPGPSGTHEYCYTLEQANAAEDGTVLQASLLVLEV